MKSLRIFFVLILGTIGLTSSASATPIPSTSFDFGQTDWDAGNGIIELSPGTTDLAVSTPTSTTSFGVTYTPYDGSRQLKINGIEEPQSILFSNGPFAVSAGSAFSWIATYADRGDAGDGGVMFFILNGLRYDMFGQAQVGVRGHDTKVINLIFDKNGIIDSFGLGCAYLAFCFSDDFQYGAPRIFTDGLPEGISGVISSSITPIAGSVPEPETWSMVLLGLFLTGLMGRARNQHPA